MLAKCEHFSFSSFVCNCFYVFVYDENGDVMHIFRQLINWFMVVRDFILSIVSIVFIRFAGVVLNWKTIRDTISMGARVPFLSLSLSICIWHILSTIKNKQTATMTTTRNQFSVRLIISFCHNEFFVFCCFFSGNTSVHKTNRFWLIESIRIFDCDFRLLMQFYLWRRQQRARIKIKNFKFRKISLVSDTTSSPSATEFYISHAHTHEHTHMRTQKTFPTFENSFFYWRHVDWTSRECDLLVECFAIFACELK